jgi:hypothetical protein
MTEQQLTDKHQANGRTNPNFTRAGRKKVWKELGDDPLSEGFDSYQAEYVVAKSQTPWGSVKSGQLFSRSKNGKGLHVKMNEGRAICLDTQQPIEVSPGRRLNFPVWLVMSFNSISTSKTEPTS